MKKERNYIKMKKSLKIGGYVRVSTDEQKKYGYSVRAQIEKITNWCDDNGHTLIEMFNDEGYTAGNMKRPALLEMLNRLKEFDVIVFTRLDRFSRNVLEANKMLEMLRAHGVNLISIEEDDIDTTTADGMFIFQLKVSLAERELKKTSERIKSVFEYKIKQGQAVTGSLPFGYKIITVDGKKYVGIDETTEHIVIEAFAHFLTYHSARATMQHINEKYGLTRCYNSYHKMLKNPFYYGHFKGIENYCPAYISKAQYERNQQLLANNIRARKTKHIYLFSQIIKCPKCGYSMVGTATTKKGKTYYSYRCNNKYMNKACDVKGSISELIIEDFIVKNANALAQSYISKVTEVKPAKKNNVEKRIKEINEEIENINYMFKKRRISAAEYDRDFEALEKELKKLLLKAEKKTDLTAVKDFLNSDWQLIYNQLDKENKRALWRNLIKEVVLDNDFNISLNFL